MGKRAGYAVVWRDTLAALGCMMGAVLVGSLSFPLAFTNIAHPAPWWITAPVCVCCAWGATQLLFQASANAYLEDHRAPRWPRG